MIPLLSPPPLPLPSFALNFSLDSSFVSDDYSPLSLSADSLRQYWAFLPFLIPLNMGRFLTTFLRRAECLPSSRKRKERERLGTNLKTSLKKTICNINWKVPANAVFTIYIFERLCFVFIQLYGDEEEADLAFPAYWRLAEPTTRDKKGKRSFLRRHRSLFGQTHKHDEEMLLAKIMVLIFWMQLDRDSSHWVWNDFF